MQPCQGLVRAVRRWPMQNVSTRSMLNADRRLFTSGRRDIAEADSLFCEWNIPATGEYRFSWRGYLDNRSMPRRKSHGRQASAPPTFLQSTPSSRGGSRATQPPWLPGLLQLKSGAAQSVRSRPLQTRQRGFRPNSARRRRRLTPSWSSSRS